MSAAQKTPSELDIPAFLMNFPFTLSADSPNNVWMEELTTQERGINHDRAFSQWRELYHFIARQAIVYILPSEGNYQDLPYVANIGVVIPNRRSTLVLSNFFSPPRRGEEWVAERFFSQMKYNIYQCPYYFEGEADLKHLRGNIMIGGYGIRTERRAIDWFSEQFGLEIIPMEMVDKRSYHLDCCIFPLSRDTVLCSTSIMKKEEVQRLEQYCNIISTPVDSVYGALTNCVRLHDTILTASNPVDQYLSTICKKFGLHLKYFNLEEFHKSGADLSCLFLTLNTSDKR